MIFADHLRTYVIRPTLKTMGLYSRQAEELLMLTAAQESRMGYYLHQLGGGPALGVFQMEPATHDDCHANYLLHKPGLAEIVSRWGDAPEDMIGNLYYATAMARIKYLRDPRPLPLASDIQGMAGYWKDVWNTHLGRGTVEQAFDAYKRYVEHA